MSDVRQILELLNEMSQIESQLRSRGVIRSRRILGDLGEWYACRLLDLELATDPSQRGYDCVDAKTGKRIQVKTDRKSGDRNATVWMPQWSGNRSTPPFDELVVIWLADDFRVRKCFRLSIEQLVEENFPRLKSGKLSLSSTRLIELGFDVDRRSFSKNKQQLFFKN